MASFAYLYVDLKVVKSDLTYMKRLTLFSLIWTLSCLSLIWLIKVVTKWVLILL